MNLIDEAIEYLLLTQERWYAKYFLDIERVEDKNVHTLGTSYDEKENIFILHWNKNYFESLTLAERTERLKHELLHIILDVFGRMTDMDMGLKNMAHDLAINQFLNETLIKDGMLIKNYPKFPKLECAEVYYKLLKQNLEKIKDKSCGRPELSLPERIKIEKQLEILKDKLRGNLPGDTNNLIDKLTPVSKRNWKQLLRQEVYGNIKSERRKTWKRFSRRLGEGYKGTTIKRIPKIILGIDTSGSIGTEEFKDFIKEIEKIQLDYNGIITVIECDAKIQKIYALNKFKKVDTNFKGGGGTDFRPLFTECQKKKTSLLIFFTDTYGAFPEKIPKFKTLWCTLNKDVKVPFGKILLIKNESTR